MSEPHHSSPRQANQAYKRSSASTFSQSRAHCLTCLIQSSVRSGAGRKQQQQQQRLRQLPTAPEHLCSGRALGGDSCCISCPRSGGPSAVGRAATGWNGASAGWLHCHCTGTQEQAKTFRTKITHADSTGSADGSMPHQRWEMGLALLPAGEQVSMVMSLT